MTKPTLEELRSIKPEYSKRIYIQHKLSQRGKSRFFIIHKKGPWSRPSITEVPKYFIARNTFDAAERAAMYLLVNYEKYFLS